MGLGVPRETLRLEGPSEDPRLVASGSRQDYTEAMKGWARSRLRELASLGLHGYILKKNSPSCGLLRVKVYGASGPPAAKGRGIFARELTTRFPLLPVEEEGRLQDPRLRGNFIECIFAYYRWTRLLENSPTSEGLLTFHTAHKLTLMAHSPQAQRQLGRLVAQAGRRPLGEVLEEYGQRFMAALNLLPTPGKHVHVLQHLMGFLKKHLDRQDQAELLEAIGGYRKGLLPLSAPITLLRHHLRRHPVPDWVHRQVYLNPDPKELLLHCPV